jgi:hypothetical protein
LSSPGTYTAEYQFSGGASIPEPQSLALVGGGFALLLLAMRRRWIRAPQAN